MRTGKLAAVTDRRGIEVIRPSRTEPAGGTSEAESRLIENAVRASEQRLKLIIDTIPALAWSARPDGGAEFFNQHYLDFVGLPLARVRDWGWAVAVHPDDLSDLVAAWQRIMASGLPGEAEARLRRHDGVYRWFLMRASPLRDDNGQITQWYGVNTDVEDRKSAEAKVQRANEHMTEAQRLSRTGSFTVDLLTQEQTWSDEFYRICELTVGSQAGMQRLQEIVHPEDMATLQNAIQRARAGADSRFDFRIVTSQGTVKHLIGAAHRVGQDTRPVIVGAIHDVTASKAAEEALSRARADLAYVARVVTLSTLTASVAHQVSQPLAGIIANASACLRMLAADPPNITGACETARRTIRDGNRAAEVITHLRALFSRREMSLEPMDLNEATKEVVSLSLNELQRNRVVVQLELAADLPPVTGDRIHLQQVLLTLLRNASDALNDISDRPRLLVIRTEREDAERVRVAVRDVGIGLDPHSVDKVFDPFFTTKSDGLGIGLSVGRSIVERHHGRIWAEANDGPGATFCISIPRAPQPGTSTSADHVCPSSEVQA
ncbi:MAG: PAS domain-containing protein [Burkholderiaceae bacterium]|nr:PAS domain-containing protein [Burkholderiaceae bacterium]